MKWEGSVQTVTCRRTMFRVELDNQHMVLATICGKMRKRWVRLTVGDRVKMEMSPYDLDKARITWRVEIGSCRGNGSSLEKDMAEQAAVKAVDAKVRIGHLHLKVADLERALRFYRDVLGFEVTQRMGNQAGVSIGRRSIIITSG